jgi:S-disulfanyl-L-cysteine oxidoreductase SoxD
MLLVQKPGAQAPPPALPERSREIRLKRATATLISIIVIAMSQMALRAQSTAGSQSVWDGVFTKEQAKRGEQLYAQNCSSCHGPDLSGNDEAAPLAGPVFLSSWDGLSIGDLANRVRVSMPPNNLGKLNRQQIVDVLSYVLSFNNFPAGKSELDPKPEVLKQIKVEATKPKAK